MEASDQSGHWQPPLLFYHRIFIPVVFDQPGILYNLTEKMRMAKVAHNIARPELVRDNAGWLLHIAMGNPRPFV